MLEGEGDSCPGKSDVPGKAVRYSGRNAGQGVQDLGGHVTLDP